MSTQDRISRLAQQLGERLQGASHAPEEFQRGVQQVVRGAFDRLELVSREDFDILMDVLQRTRSRVEALEKQVAALESALDAKALSAGEEPPAKKAPLVTSSDDASAHPSGIQTKAPATEGKTPDVKQEAADKDKQNLGTENAGGKNPGAI
ncbi:accessory factor UbiK family protein [Pistricoccus aurantiacus]|uniref:accessory factor UbiK family protein n=1 Tax=Pistricoccus aurantiacus TaxID=1883414 RepID=UPI00363B3F98